LVKGPSRNFRNMHRSTAAALFDRARRDNLFVCGTARILEPAFSITRWQT